MQRILIAAIAVALGTVTAAAQTYDWSGFYAGKQVGWFNGTGWTEYDEVRIGTWDVNGPFAGIFAGVNWQSTPWVFGIEGDFNFASAAGGGEGVAQVVYEYGSTVTSFGSLRKRVGFATGNWLFFGTAGVAFANGVFWSCEPVEDECVDYENEDVHHVGFVVGGGVEYALSDTISIRKDIRFYNFGEQEVQLGGVEEFADYYLTAVTASIGIAFHF